MHGRCKTAHANPRLWLVLPAPDGPMMAHLRRHSGVTSLSNGFQEETVLKAETCPGEPSLRHSSRSELAADLGLQLGSPGNSGAGYFSKFQIAQACLGHFGVLLLQKCKSTKAKYQDLLQSKPLQTESRHRLEAPNLSNACAHLQSASPFSNLQPLVRQHCIIIEPTKSTSNTNWVPD